VSAVAALDGDLLILGAGGKMGPSLARLARRAADEAGVKKRVVAVARFTNSDLLSDLAALGIETMTADLLDPGTLNRLQIFERHAAAAVRRRCRHLTGAMNLPTRTVAETLSTLANRNSRRAMFIRCVHGGKAERDHLLLGEGVRTVGAVGECSIWIDAINYQLYICAYAVELRYGVLVDIGRSVFEGRPIDLCMPYVNVIWQRDANAWCLRSFAHCSSPPAILNITGPKTLSVRELAMEFGRHFGIDPIFVSDKEGSSALLSDVNKATSLFGSPTVRPAEMIEWTANWIRAGGAMLNRPTHFQTRDGIF
jgi:hypothetical protein